ncbi:MAG: (2Fe-2S)-binding protein [Pikeienuella sp.]
MKIASRFQTPPDQAAEVQLTIDGETVTAPAGVSVAAAMLAHTGGATRITAKGSERTAFCMMGVCFECLVDIDGHPNTQACMTTVRNGMVINRQIGLRRLNGDFDG